MVLTSSSLITYILVLSGAWVGYIVATPWLMFVVWGSPMVALQQYKHQLRQVKFERELKKVDEVKPTQNAFEE